MNSNANINTVSTADTIQVSAACKDVRFLGAIRSELGRIGIELDEYNGADVPAILLIDIDDHSSLARELGESPTALVGWTKSKDLDTVNADGRYAAVLHRPFLMDDFLLRIVSLLYERGIIKQLLSDRYAQLESGILPAVGDAFMLGGDPLRSISVSASAHSVSVGGENVKLSPKEWSIFKYIYDRKGKVVSREELAGLIGADGGANTVDVHVCHLREKIESRTGIKIFHTVRGVGYKMK